MIFVSCAHVVQVCNSCQQSCSARSGWTLPALFFLYRVKTSNHSKNDRSSGFAVNIRRGLRLFSLFILFQSQSALRNTFYICAVGKTIPTIQLGNDLSATVLRYLRLQEQKQLVETRVKTLDAEMQRLKGRIVAKLNSSCMAMGKYVTMSESRRFSIKAKEADEAP